MQVAFWQNVSLHAEVGASISLKSTELYSAFLFTVLHSASQMTSPQAIFTTQVLTGLTVQHWTMLL